MNRVERAGRKIDSEFARPRNSARGSQSDQQYGSLPAQIAGQLREKAAEAPPGEASGAHRGREAAAHFQTGELARDNALVVLEQPVPKLPMIVLIPEVGTCDGAGIGEDQGLPPSA